MKIIPAIDIIGGKCVRLTHGDFTKQKIYNESPAEVAKQFEAAGIERLHLVDLDGAKSGEIKNIEVLKEIAVATKLQIDFGGGIKNEAALKLVFEAGAAMATIGSLAVKQPDTLAEWISIYGTDKFFIGADVLENNIKIAGWQQDGAIDIFTFINNMLSIGAIHFFCTDIQKDGAMQGASVALYKTLIEKFPGVNITASGGVTTVNDLDLLKEAGCAGAIIGKAIYEQTISLNDLSKYN
jgi:phosphoribosylformimino-5-aminoimidazole carboxamide ribotide isomerase